MKTKIYLIRHADSVYTPDDLNRPISDKGLRDVKELSTLLKLVKIDKVYSSPYKRSIQTVELIAKSRNLSIELIEEFKERTKINGHLDNFFINVKKLWDEENFKFDGGESNVEGQIRGIQALGKVLEKNFGKTIVIGTHGDLMSLILNYYNKQYDYEFWKALDMPDAYMLEFDEKKLITIESIWNRN